MNTRTMQLVGEVKRSRNAYLELIVDIAETAAQYKPDEQSWNIVDITEHLYWAEHGGLAGMWKTLYAIRNNVLLITTSSSHENMTIEQIIAVTWKEKEQVPAVAAPRMGGTIAFWREAFNSLQSILESFGNDITDEELFWLAHPHPISGDMNFHQRLEFLRFHIDRHSDQVKRLLDSYNK